MSEKQTTKFKCAVCGKLTTGRIPGGGKGDTTVRFPRHHKHNGKPCPGNIEEAEWVTELVIPRRPWVMSNQYGMKFVLSQDNEIILGNKACEAIPEGVLRMILDTVNSSRSMTPEERKSLNDFTMDDLLSGLPKHHEGAD